WQQQRLSNGPQAGQAAGAGRLPDPRSHRGQPHSSSGVSRRARLAGQNYQHTDRGDPGQRLHRLYEYVRLAWLWTGPNIPVLIPRRATSSGGSIFRWLRSATSSATTAIASTIVATRAVPALPVPC